VKENEDANWTVDFPFGHWGQIWCPAHVSGLDLVHAEERGEPRRKIRRAVERCAHQKPGEENDA
jgi:hypothetical protein